MSVPVFCDELEAVGWVHLTEGHDVITQRAVTYVLDSEERELVVRVSLCLHSVHAGRVEELLVADAHRGEVLGGHPCYSSNNTV